MSNNVKGREGGKEILSALCKDKQTKVVIEEWNQEFREAMIDFLDHAEDSERTGFVHRVQEAARFGLYFPKR